jgi:hypothetical protein
MLHRESTTADEDSIADGDEPEGGLRFSDTQIEELAYCEPDKDHYKLTHQEHEDRYVWLACSFLQGILSVETWKQEVINTADKVENRRNIFQWTDHSDLAYLCVLYIHSYKKWKKEDDMRREQPNLRLNRALKEELNQLGKYQPDGISSREAQERYHQIKKHIHQKIKNVPGNKEKFNTAFWDYLDRHVLPRSCARVPCKKRPAQARQRRGNAGTGETGSVAQGTAGDAWYGRGNPY